MRCRTPTNGSGAIAHRLTALTFEELVGVCEHTCNQQTRHEIMLGLLWSQIGMLRRLKDALRDNPPAEMAPMLIMQIRFEGNVEEVANMFYLTIAAIDQVVNKA